MAAQSRFLVRFTIAGAAIIAMAGVAAATFTSPEQASICNAIAAAINGGTLQQSEPGGAIGISPGATPAQIDAFTDTLRGLGLGSGTECFECPAGALSGTMVCITFSAASGEHAEHDGRTDADIVIAIAGNSTGSAPGGNATANATTSPGAAAIADGGDGRTDPTGPGTNGGTGEAEGNGDCHAQGGNGGGGKTTGAHGGDADATTYGGQGSVATAQGGSGGDPTNNESQGGNSGDATAGSPNGAGGTTSRSAGQAKATPGTHGVSGTQSSTQGNNTNLSPPARVANS